ncbi:hypothetical protein [Thioclava sp. GXIMD4216]|uniref:Lipopolysaccharide export system protein LptC n=1 Tax=Thioclava litoralis TaxID=3076557 RepID=A0ABZ1DV42_9RHOB|nr:hypothetical protein RPE78_07750 [Thioclava sp. FTW29]
MIRDNRHSILVAWAKTVLPLAALVLLSLVFLVGHRVEPGSVIPYSDVDIAELAREPQVVSPEYSGLTQDGAALSVRASKAVLQPMGANGSSVAQLVAKLQARSGLVVDLNAKAGELRPDAGLIELRDRVALQTSSGYRMQSELVEMTTDRTKIVSPGAVHGEAPMGVLDAGAMELSQAQPGGPNNLLFTKGVKLVYQPQE